MPAKAFRLPCGPPRKPRSHRRTEIASKAAATMTSGSEILVMAVAPFNSTADEFLSGADRPKNRRNRNVVAFADDVEARSEGVSARRGIQRILGAIPRDPGPKRLGDRVGVLVVG